MELIYAAMFGGSVVGLAVLAATAPRRQARVKVDYVPLSVLVHRHDRPQLPIVSPRYVSKAKTRRGGRR